MFSCPTLHITSNLGHSWHDFSSFAPIWDTGISKMHVLKPMMIDICREGDQSIVAEWFTNCNWSFRNFHHLPHRLWDYQGWKGTNGSELCWGTGQNVSGTCIWSHNKRSMLRSGGLGLMFPKTNANRDCWLQYQLATRTWTFGEGLDSRRGLVISKARKRLPFPLWMAIVRLVDGIICFVLVPPAIARSAHSVLLLFVKEKTMK